MASALARSGVVSELLSGRRNTPTHRAVEWAKALSLPILETIQSCAYGELDRLTEAVDHLPKAVASQAHYAQDMAMSILRRRDDLESVLFVLHTAGQGELLAEALSGFDRMAVCSSFTTFSRLLDLNRDDRLWQVAWQEPMAWWAQI